MHPARATSLALRGAGDCVPRRQLHRVGVHVRRGFAGRQGGVPRLLIGRAWDIPTDMRAMEPFVEVYLKLWYTAKPTIAAVQGWCIGGGTDMVLCADIVVAAAGASFGYPPSRVWGTPTTAMWVYRLGFEKAKRYLLTGDEIRAPEAARIGLILEAVPDAELHDRAVRLASRMARLPLNQLVMLKRLVNQT